MCLEYLQALKLFQTKIKQSQTRKDIVHKPNVLSQFEINDTKVVAFLSVLSSISVIQGACTKCPFFGTDTKSSFLFQNWEVEKL